MRGEKEVSPTPQFDGSSCRRSIGDRALWERNSVGDLDHRDRIRELSLWFGHRCAVCGVF